MLDHVSHNVQATVIELPTDCTSKLFSAENQKHDIYFTK